MPEAAAVVAAAAAERGAAAGHSSPKRPDQQEAIGRAHNAPCQPTKAHRCQSARASSPGEGVRRTVIAAIRMVHMTFRRSSSSHEGLDCAGLGRIAGPAGRRRRWRAAAAAAAAVKSSVGRAIGQPVNSIYVLPAPLRSASAAAPPRSSRSAANMSEASRYESVDAEGASALTSKGWTLLDVRQDAGPARLLPLPAALPAAPLSTPCGGRASKIGWMWRTAFPPTAAAAAGRCCRQQLAAALPRTPPQDARGVRCGACARRSEHPLDGTDFRGAAAQREVLGAGGCGAAGRGASRGSAAARACACRRRDNAPLGPACRSAAPASA